MLNSNWYRKTCKRLLTLEINDKKRLIDTKESELKISPIRNLVTLIDYIWISRVIKSNVTNYEKIVTERHDRKLKNLGLTYNLQIDPQEVIKNFSKRILTTKEKSILSLGLSFNIPNYKLDYFDYFLKFESMVRNLNTEIQILDRDTFMSSLKQTVQHYYNIYNSKKIFSPLFSFNDLRILKTLKKDSNIVISRPDKGKGVVIMDKDEYIHKMNTLLSDKTKYKPLPHTDTLKHIIAIEDKLNRITRSIKSSTFNHQHLHISGTTPGIMYGVPKTHKPSIPLRPVLSAINTPSYKLAKTFIPILNPLTTNEYTLTDSFSLAEQLQNIQFTHSFLTSFDIQNLFTNIPVFETIDIIINTLYPNNTTILHDLTSTQFRKLLTNTVSNSPFIFHNQLYTQTDGMPMGSPLGPTFANIFLSHHEKQWIQSCPLEFKPLLYKRYVDDLLIIFKDPSHVNPFLQYLNKQHKNIIFTLEIETNHSLPFLDILITHNNTSFNTSVYRKPSNTMLGTNYFSFTHKKFILSSIQTFLVRAYRLSSNWSLFHQEITHLRNYFSFNLYPNTTIDFHINKLLNNILDPPPLHLTVPQLKLYIKVPFLGHLSSQLHKDLLKLFHQHIPQSRPILIPHNPLTIKSFFNIKDTLPVLCRSSVVYKYSCGSCTATYIGHTGLHLHERISKHRGLSFRTNRPLSQPEHSPIRQHSLEHDHIINTHNFTILRSCSIETHRKILESLYINKIKPNLNTMNSSLPLLIA